MFVSFPSWVVEARADEEVVEGEVGEEVVEWAVLAVESADEAVAETEDVDEHPIGSEVI